MHASNQNGIRYFSDGNMDKSAESGSNIDKSSESDHTIINRGRVRVTLTSFRRVIIPSTNRRRVAVPSTNCLTGALPDDGQDLESVQEHRDVAAAAAPVTHRFSLVYFVFQNAPRCTASMISNFNPIRWPVSPLRPTLSCPTSDVVFANANHQHPTLNLAFRVQLVPDRPLFFAFNPTTIATPQPCNTSTNGIPQPTNASCGQSARTRANEHHVGSSSTYRT
jgi:hypothetical protein